MNPGFVKKVTALSVVWFLMLGAVFGGWYLEQNDLRFLRDAVYKGRDLRALRGTMESVQERVRA